ncbi:MAG: hypothetical protein ACJ72Q_21100, partial [Nitrososphaeraceae archaeon]
MYSTNQLYPLYKLHSLSFCSDGGGMPVPGVPVVTADNKHKDKERNGAGGRGPPVPGLPVVTSDGNDGDNRDGYNNRNIKSFDTS